LTGCDPAPVPSSHFGMARLRSPRSLLPNASGNTGQAPDVRRTNTRCRRRGVSSPDFASSRNPRRSTCLRDARPQRFCRLRTETAGTREKSKSLPHNKFTHVNAPAASGIPAAPYLGMTCRSVNPVRKHRTTDGSSNAHWRPRCCSTEPARCSE
jgi:hypothetical protein